MCFVVKLIYKKTVKFTVDTLDLYIKCINILEYRRSKPVLRKSRTIYENLRMKSSQRRKMILPTKMMTKKKILKKKNIFDTYFLILN